MSNTLIITADTNDFQFQALQEAKNYRGALIKEFRDFLRGNVLEVGAGVGEMSEQLIRLPGVTRAVSVEPDPACCARHRHKLPGHELVEGTVEQVPDGMQWNAILSINVLEHIHDDDSELDRYGELLHSRHGTLCLFVPARPEIYAPIDKDFGHFRRYTRRQLRRKLVRAGFEILRLNYFNCVGYFAWWLNFCLFKKRVFEAKKVEFFDRIIFPVVHAMESKIMRPPFGQSLIAVARR
jgi:SAM-dependent methyltransferase